MNNLSWLLYWADVLPSLDTGVLLVIGMTSITSAILGLIFTVY